ncbi:MAG: DinB family protein [Bacteroidales bacterium]
MEEIEKVALMMENLVLEWEPRLLEINPRILESRRNSQGRGIKQILGHLVDSNTNNTHRVVHLHYQDSPFSFPNYATFGNNDRWIAIQDYQHEDWINLVKLWKHTLLHFCHVIRNIDEMKLDKQWISGPGKLLTMREMVVDFPRHLNLHLGEIDDLQKGEYNSPH